MKRRWLLFIGTVGILTAGLLSALCWYFRDPINFENYERIQQGMSEADVERILGRPADEVFRYNTTKVRGPDGWHEGVESKFNNTWRGNGAEIVVPFGANGTVDGLIDFGEQDTTILKIRRWLGMSTRPHEGA